MRKMIALTLLGLLMFACSRKTVPAVMNKPVEKVSEVDTARLAILAHGKEIYTARCGRCHKLYATTDYTVAQWKPVLDRMIPKARLAEGDSKEVTAYVLANAKM